MPTHIEQELGIAPTTNRIRRWFRKLIPNAVNSLDPLTVNYEVWHAMNRNVRQWPSYQEAPNYVEVYVSPEDWNQYWGIDTVRKEAGVAAYVKARIAEKGYWIAGEPQIMVFVDDTIAMGDFDIFCQFAEPLTAEELARQKMDLAYDSARLDADADLGTSTDLLSHGQPMAGAVDAPEAYDEFEADPFDAGHDEPLVDVADSAPRSYSYGSNVYDDEDGFEDAWDDEDELEFEDVLGDAFEEEAELENGPTEVDLETAEPSGAEAVESELGLEEPEPNTDEDEFGFEPPAFNHSEGEFNPLDPESDAFVSASDFESDEAAFVAFGPESDSYDLDTELDGAAFATFGPEFRSDFELGGIAFEYESFDTAPVDESADVSALVETDESFEEPSAEPSDEPVDELFDEPVDEPALPDSTVEEVVEEVVEDEAGDLVYEEAYEEPNVPEPQKADKSRVASIAQQFIELFWGDKRQSGLDENPEDDASADAFQEDAEQLEFADESFEADGYVEPLNDDDSNEPFEVAVPVEEPASIASDEPLDGADGFDEADSTDEGAAMPGDDDWPLRVDVGYSEDGLPAFVPVSEPGYTYSSGDSFEFGTVTQAADEEGFEDGREQLFDQSYEYDSSLDDYLEPEPEPEPEPEHVEVQTPEPAAAPQRSVAPSAHFVDQNNPGYLYLIGRSAFRLEIHAGDCIGAVRWGEDVPEEVNVRLDADGFPYAEVMQCTIDVQNGRWCVTNHAAHGTRLTKATGERYLLGKPEPYPIDPDDILWLGHERPLRVEY
jgi:hypothetical protein